MRPPAEHGTWSSVQQGNNGMSVRTYVCLSVSLSLHVDVKWYLQCPLLLYLSFFLQCGLVAGLKDLGSCKLCALEPEPQTLHPPQRLPGFSAKLRRNCGLLCWPGPYRLRSVVFFVGIVQPPKYFTEALSWQLVLSAHAHISFHGPSALEKSSGKSQELGAPENGGSLCIKPTERVTPL